MDNTKKLDCEIQIELSEEGSDHGIIRLCWGFKQGPDVTNPLNVLRPIDTKPSDSGSNTVLPS